MSKDSKRRKIEFVSPLKTTLAADTGQHEIDWEKCFICQDVKKEPLQCSFNNKIPDQEKVKTAYSELAGRMLEFDSENIMPIEVDLVALAAGGNLGQTLYENKASHHKSCKLMFSATKLELAKERKCSNQEVSTPIPKSQPVQIRRTGKKLYIYYS